MVDVLHITMKENKTHKGGVMKKEINLDNVLEELGNAKTSIEQSTWEFPKGIDDELGIRNQIAEAAKAVENAIEYINDMILED